LVHDVHDVHDYWYYICGQQHDRRLAALNATVPPFSAAVTPACTFVCVLAIVVLFVCLFVRLGVTFRDRSKARWDI